MSFLLGNLSISEIEEKAGIKLSDECKEFMASTRQDEASNIAKGKWHCFDIPFTIICGDMETAQKIYDYVKDLDFKTKMQISIVGG